MGTSQSSNGSPSGSPMVPPWVPDIPLPKRPDVKIGEGAGEDSEAGDNQSNSGRDENQNKQPKSQEVKAPPSRFGNARRSMGDYVRTGDKSSLQKSLGQYIKKGYGGSSTATRRMASTAQTAQLLYSALSRGGDAPSVSDNRLLDSASLAGKTAYEIMDVIVEAVRPIDGTQDAEVSRNSIKDALADVLNLYPDANLNELSDFQKELVIERFVAGDVFQRIDLDLGKTIRERAPSTSAALGHLKEIKEYVRETVASAFRDLKNIGHQLTDKSVTQIVQNAIRETCDVFEGYAE